MQFLKELQFFEPVNVDFILINRFVVAAIEPVIVAVNRTIDNILSLTANISKYVPFFGATYIPLPEKIKYKKSIINPKNKDFIKDFLRKMKDRKSADRKCLHFFI